MDFSSVIAPIMKMAKTRRPVSKTLRSKPAGSLLKLQQEIAQKSLLKNPVVVFGLGVTGLSCVEFLSAKGYTLQVVDTRSSPPEIEKLQKQFPWVPIHLGEPPQSVLQEAGVIVLSPGISVNHPCLQPALAKGIPIIGDIEIFALYADAPVIALTGTNGKSTVTSLLGHMAKKAQINAGVGGNLGIPALSLLQHDRDLYILELSSFQLETTYSLQPIVASVLNVSPDHLDRYACMTDYQTAKLRIYQNCYAVVYNREDPATVPQQLSHHSEMQYATFGLDQAPMGHYGVLEKEGERWLARGEEYLLPCSKIPLMGDMNIKNVLAALAMGDLANFSDNAMLEGIQTFQGLSHRCEKVLLDGDVLWVNDSKATNVGATLATLDGLKDAISGKWVILLGGQSKNADFSGLLEPVQQRCSAVILLGEATLELQQLFQDRLPCHPAKDMLHAVKLADQLAKPGDGILLAPACSSLDMFKNFEARGQAFCQAVHTLKQSCLA